MLLCLALTVGHQPDHQPIRRGACLRASGSASAHAVHRLVLIERSLASRPAFHTGFRVSRTRLRALRRDEFPPRSAQTSLARRSTHRCILRLVLVMLCPARLSVKGTKLAGRCRASPSRATRAAAPGVASPYRDSPGWGAGTRLDRAAAHEGRARCRPRPPRGEAKRTWPRVPCSQHMCAPGNFPAAPAYAPPAQAVPAQMGAARISRSFRM
jgi:hypothetical protein